MERAKSLTDDEIRERLDTVILRLQELRTFIGHQLFPRSLVNKIYKATEVFYKKVMNTLFEKSMEVHVNELVDIYTKFQNPEVEFNQIEPDIRSLVKKIPSSSYKDFFQVGSADELVESLMVKSPEELRGQNVRAKELARDKFGLALRGVSERALRNFFSDNRETSITDFLGTDETPQEKFADFMVTEMGMKRSGALGLYKLIQDGQVKSDDAVIKFFSM